jgi:hypothetical protein
MKPNKYRFEQELDLSSDFFGVSPFVWEKFEEKRKNVWTR